MILFNLINEKLHSATSKLILYAILERAEFEKKTVIKIEQTYISELCCCTKQTVCNELKYLANEGYITYQRSIFQTNGKKLTTTQITLTEKSVNLININTSTAKQNKAQILTKTNPINKDIVRENKMPKKAEKEPKTEDNKVLLPNNTNTESNTDDLKKQFEKLTREQQDLLKFIMSCNSRTFLQYYIAEATKQNINNNLINFFILKNNNQFAHVMCKS